jgi:hypothetical protein
MELVVSCFKQDWGVGGAKNRMFKEVSRLFSIGCRRLLEKHVLPSFECFESPLVMQAVREGIIDAVYGWIVDKI